MPVSKQEFVITLNTIFNSDKHRNDIAAIGLFNIPPGLAPPVLAPPVVPVPPVPVPVPPVPAPGPVPVPAPGPVPVPAPGPLPGPPIPPPRQPTRSNTLIIPPNFKLLIDDLNILRNQIPQTANVLTKKNQTENAIGDLAYIEMVDKNTLARYLINKPRAPIPQPVLDFAEQLLLYAESQSKAAFAAA